MTENLQPTDGAGKRTLLILGRTTFRRQHRRFGLLAEDRLRHLLVLGKTGTGKSTLLQSLVIQDLEDGNGLALLDPHGDLVDAVLPHVPAGRVPDVILFDPEDRGHPISFNVFRLGRRPHPDRSLLASHLVAVFKKQWSEFWGPRLEHVLRNAVLAVADDPRASLVFLYRFLTDEKLREQVVARVRDPVVRRFWTDELALYSKDLQGEALAPALNKLGAFVASPIARNIVGQERSRLDLPALMDRRGVLLARLPAGKIGEDASRLLGGLLLTSIQLAAMARERRRPAFHVVADEFQCFVTDAVATMLSEARKFGLGLVLAHQYLRQLPETVRDAVLGNVGSMMLFRLGAADARVLAEDLAPEIAMDDLLHLERYQAAVRLTARGETLRPFTAETLAPREPPADAAAIVERIRRSSRARYARPRALVEAALHRAL